MKKEFKVIDVKEYYTNKAILTSLVKLKTPFIIRDYQPEISNYGLNLIQCIFEDFEADVLEYEDRSERFKQVINHYKTMNLSEYIDDIKEGRTTLYLEQSRVEELMPGLKDDLPIDELFEFGVNQDLNCWIGPKGTQSSLHYDLDNNFFLQAEGRKEVNLVSPQDSKHCYRSLKSFYDGFSPVDTYNFDCTSHPDFIYATVYNATLNPGDMLYIPATWWHDIRSLDVSVTYNVWWLNRSDFMKTIFKECWHRFKSIFGITPPMEDKQSYIVGLLKKR